MKTIFSRMDLITLLNVRHWSDSKLMVTKGLFQLISFRNLMEIINETKKNALSRFTIQVPVLYF